MALVKWCFVLTCVLVQRNTQIERKKELTPRSFTFHSVILDKTRKICTKLSSYVIYVGASVNWVRFVSTGIQSPIGPPVFLRERERARGEERRKSLSCCSGNLPFSSSLILDSSSDFEPQDPLTLYSHKWAMWMFSRLTPGTIFLRLATFDWM